MNLNAIANAACQVVTPNVLGDVLTCTGSSTAPNGKRTPAYTTTTGVAMQVQALSGRELAHMDSLNIQGIMRAVYVNMRVQGANRSAGIGGDLLMIPTGLTAAASDTWLVETVLEPWDGPGWCKVAVTLQVTP